jgi:hypothetical protein
MRDAAWRTALASRDPFAAARAVPLDAPVGDRRAAAELIWSFYLDRDIWIVHRTDRDLVDDASVVARLVKADDLGDVRGQIELALRSESPQARGNAMRVLALAGLGTPSRAIFRTLLDDSETPVVRRMAAAAAADLKLRSVVPLLIKRVLNPAEDSELQDIALALRDLVTEDERTALACLAAQGASSAFAAAFLSRGLSPRDRLTVFRCWAAAHRDAGSYASKDFAETVAALLDTEGIDADAAEDVAYVAVVWRVPTAQVKAILRDCQDASYQGMERAMRDGTAREYALGDFVDCFDIDLLVSHDAPAYLIEHRRLTEHQ